MAKIIFIIIELIILGISVIMIYDARKIATKIFSSNETNETTKVLKIVGFIALIISLLMIYITKIKMWKIKYWYSLVNKMWNKISKKSKKCFTFLRRNIMEEKIEITKEKMKRK